MQILSVSWNPKTDEIKVHLDKEFASFKWNIRADVLYDIIGKIEELYPLELEAWGPQSHEDFEPQSNITTLEIVK